MLTGDSSDGRAIDCRSIGRAFDSPSPDYYKDDLIHCKVNITAPIVQRLGFIASNDEARVRLPVGALLKLFICLNSTVVVHHTCNVKVLSSILSSGSYNHSRLYQ